MSTLQDAREALLNGDLNTAQVIAADLLKTDPNSAGAWYVLSEAVEGDRKEIFRKKALAINPDIASEFMPDVSTAEEIEDFFLEDDPEDDVMSLSSSDFPDLQGPADAEESDQPAAVLSESSTDANAEDDLDGFYVEPTTYDDADVSTSEETDSGNEESVDAGSGFSFDTNAIILGILAVLIALVLWQLVSSL